MLGRVGESGVFENESLVIRALEQLSQGRTVLMLTHRLTNIQHMDRIMVLENGCIIEQGTFSELRAAGGVFHQFINRGGDGGKRD